MKMNIKNKVVKNATWIIACRIIQAILGVIVTMISARYLGPSGYGLISYAASIVTFVAPIMQLGLSSTLVSELIDYPEREGETLGTAILMSICSGVCCIIGIVGFTSVANHGEKTTIFVCALYSILLIFQAIDLIQYWFQAKLQSKYVSIVMLIAYIFTSCYKIILLVAGGSIYWFAISQALDYCLIAVSLLIIYKKIGAPKLSISINAMRRMFSRSKYYIVSGLMVSLFGQIDKIMINLTLGETETGYYAAAITGAGLFSFAISAIIESARPSILETKKHNEFQYEKKVVLLYSIIIYLSIGISIAFTLLAKPIIYILYGKYYQPSIEILRVIVWYTAFSYFGGASSVWILAEEKQKYLLLLNFVGAIANIILNIILINLFGTIGAAIASLITQIFTNIVMMCLIKSLRRNVVLFFKALNPLIIIKSIRKEKGDK